MTTTQKDRARAFHALHHGGRILVLPNAWDAGSAAVIAAAGASAVATTSGGVSWSLGFRDGQHAGRDEPCCSHDSARARQLANLDRRAGAAHLDRASGPGRPDDVLPRGARAGVDKDLNEIAFCHALFMPRFPRFQATPGRD